MNDIDEMKGLVTMEGSTHNYAQNNKKYYYDAFKII